MAKYKATLPQTEIEYDFEPTLENAPVLLMEIATLIEKVQYVPSEPQPASDKTTHDLLVENTRLRDENLRLKSEKQNLLLQIRELHKPKEIDHVLTISQPSLEEVYAFKPSSEKKVKKASPILSQEQRDAQRARMYKVGVPKIGELVKIMPHDEYKFWTNGIVRGFKGQGVKYVTVLPKNHAHTEDILRKYIRRLNPNETPTDNI